METRLINPWTWQDQFGFNQGQEVTGAERVLFLSGQTSVDADGQVLHAGDMAGQIGTAIDNIEAVLKGGDMTLANVVRLGIYTTDVDLFIQHAAVMARLNEAGCDYTSTLLGVSRLAFPELLVELEATAVA